MSTGSKITADLYNGDEYKVARDVFGNVFAWKKRGDYRRDRIELDELPDEVKNEVLKEII